VASWRSASELAPPFLTEIFRSILKSAGFPATRKPGLALVTSARSNRQDNRQNTTSACVDRVLRIPFGTRHGGFFDLQATGRRSYSTEEYDAGQKPDVIRGHIASAVTSSADAGRTHLATQAMQHQANTPRRRVQRGLLEIFTHSSAKKKAPRGIPHISAINLL
jgi:hypothetical protein